MKQRLARFFSDYGTVLALVLLCGLFSAITYSEQSPTGRVAAEQVAARIRREFGVAPRVMIAPSWRSA